MRQLLKSLLGCLVLLVLASQSTKAQYYMVLTANQPAISDLEASLQQLKQYANQVHIVLPSKAPNNDQLQQLAHRYNMACIQDDAIYNGVAPKEINTSIISLYNQQNSLVQQLNTQQLDETAIATIHKTLSQTYDYSTLFWESSALDANTYVSYSNLHFFVDYKNADTQFSVNSNDLELDETNNMLRISNTTQNNSSFISTSTDKTFISIQGCSINKDGTFNIIASYNENYNNPELPYARSIQILTFNSKKEITASRIVDNNDATAETSTIYHLFGDSILTLTTVFRATNTYNVQSYKNKGNQFKQDATLPLKVNTLFEKLLANNFMLPTMYRYPYFTTRYDNAIYNAATKSFINLIPEKTYNNYVSQVIMEHASTSKSTNKNIGKYYHIHDLYYNKANKKLYVAYQENSNYYLNIYNKENKLLKTISLDNALGNTDSKEFYYSFNDQFKTLVQSFYIDKEIRSHTLSIDLIQ